MSGLVVTVAAEQGRGGYAFPGRVERLDALLDRLAEQAVSAVVTDAAGAVVARVHPDGGIDR